MPANESSRSTCRSVKLFVGGLTRNTTTKLLREHFSKYGRILDCVAMMQPDGRPRGFGYVTLDSLAAAEKCLAEKQVIDGRVVDMKRAVPGTSGGKGVQRPAGAHNKGKQSDTPLFPPGAWSIPTYSPTAAQIMAAQAALAAQSTAATAAWAAAWAAASPKHSPALDCLNLLRQGSVSSTPTSMCESLNLLSSDASCRSLGCMEWSGFGMTPSSTPTALSDSPQSSKCFGAVRGGDSELTPPQPHTDDEVTPQKVAVPAEPTSQRRGVLADITNLSPIKIKLPSSSQCTSSVFDDEAFLARSFRAKPPSALMFYDENLDEEKQDADVNLDSMKSPGLLLPPGLSPPRHLQPQPFAKQSEKLGMAPLLPR
eukprot:TRINITY_DN14277_c0_g1_i1.p1 TRINITY_DN14277_c0_g1~~TRINITY_DN14277_c0_g1_i1.p1  ORF type:complete len:369 (+),score=46.12 TRINITY_DN14277_c0_g1_i1:47-1153(+)